MKKANFLNRLKKNLRGRRLVLVLILAYIVIAGGTELAATVMSSNGPYCASIDITECSVGVLIVNDNNVKYTIDQCNGGKKVCEKVQRVASLSPGKIYKTRGRTDKTPPQVLIAKDESGLIRGCVNLQFTKDTPSPITVKLSEAISCKDFL